MVLCYLWLDHPKENNGLGKPHIDPLYHSFMALIAAALPIFIQFQARRRSEKLGQLNLRNRDDRGHAEQAEHQAKDRHWRDPPGEYVADNEEVEADEGGEDDDAFEEEHGIGAQWRVVLGQNAGSGQRRVKG
ncbi:hypothetical protein MMC34_007482 [Xylographa carneopallida]|nr:hypothetical protein [Xylographa carneopallida]